MQHTPTTGLLSAAISFLRKATLNGSAAQLKTGSALAVLLISGLLTACDGTSKSDGADTYDFSPATEVTGAAIDGPLIDADVAVYILDLNSPDLRSGSALATGSTNDQADIEGLTIAEEDIGNGPFLIEFTCDNCTDAVTQTTPVIGTLRTTVTALQLIRDEASAYATALSTLALEIAHHLLVKNPELTPEAALAQAEAMVKNIYNFGLLPDDIDLFTTAALPSARQDQAQSLNYFVATETFTAMIESLQMDPANAAETVASLITKLGEDLADSEINGMNDGVAIAPLSDIADLTTQITTIPANVRALDDPSCSTLGPIFSALVTDLSLDLELSIDTPNCITITTPLAGVDTDLDGTLDNNDFCPNDASGQTALTCVSYVISGSGSLRAPEGSTYEFVNSDYEYTGTGTVNDSVFSFDMVQATTAATGGTAFIAVEGYFSVDTGLGESTITGCTGLDLICGTINPSVGTASATSAYDSGSLTSEDGTILTSLDGIRSFSWRQDDDVETGFGIADSKTILFANKPGGADSDGDGIVDDLDNCDATPENVDIDPATGCELDYDNDGVGYSTDLCPGTAPGTTVDASGCPADTDADGVIDDLDICPTTPANTDVDDTGCPTDLDGDGVLNTADLCAATAQGVTVDANGCPLGDSDGDGVLDGADSCANTYLLPSEVDAIGCPLDDNDGVDYDLDNCPNTPAGYPVDVDGCALDINIVGQQVDEVVESIQGLIDGTTSTFAPPPPFTGTYNPDTNAYSIALDNYTLTVFIPGIDSAINTVTNATQQSDGTVGNDILLPSEVEADATGVVSNTSTAVCSSGTAFLCSPPAIAPYAVLTDISWDGTTGSFEIQINLGPQGGIQTINYTFTAATP